MIYEDSSHSKEKNKNSIWTRQDNQKEENLIGTRNLTSIKAKNHTTLSPTSKERSNEFHASYESIHNRRNDPFMKLNQTSKDFITSNKKTGVLQTLNPIVHSLDSTRIYGNESSYKEYTNTMTNTRTEKMYGTMSNI